MRKITLLVIEDEIAIRDMIRFSLSPTDYVMLEAENSKEALLILAKALPDIIIVDWMLPGKGGVDFIKWLKTQGHLKQIPTIMLTAKAEEENKIKGLEAGADDYITKPFSPRELLARIKAVLRRGGLVSPEGVIKIQDLVINIDAQEVSIKDAKLALTPIEFRLLQFFITRPQRVYSRDHIITNVWGAGVYIDERTVDVQIRRLRDRLKPYGYHHLIKTVRSSGYQFIRE